MVADTSPPAELSDYLTIQPRRTDMIMKWLNEPYLKEALEGRLACSQLCMYVLHFDLYCTYVCMTCTVCI